MTVWALVERPYRSQENCFRWDVGGTEEYFGMLIQETRMQFAGKKIPLEEIADTRIARDVAKELGYKVD